MLLTDKQIKKIRRAFKKVDRFNLAKLLVESGKRNYIDQVATGKKLVSPRRAIEIERITYKKISRFILRPDIFEG